MALRSGGVLEIGMAIDDGVRSRLALTEQAGFKLDRAVAVSASHETSMSGIYATGDITLARCALQGEHSR